MSKTKTARKWQRENVPLKRYHYFLATVKQLFCVHASLVYLEITTQSTPDGGRLISFASGCKRCGWVKHNGGYGMPKIGRNSYDRIYLKITNTNDTLLSDIKRQKEKRELYEQYDKANGTDWVKTL